MHFPSISGFFSPRAWGADLLEAARLLTRLPLPRPSLPQTPQGAPEARASHASRCYPLVGAGIGLIAALGFAVADWLALPPFAAALAALALSILITGALHEDGLADVADGFGGGGDRARKLAIMRDSRIGSYGVLALVLVLTARGGSLAVIAASPAGPCGAAAALIAAHSLSRAGLAPVMWALPQARSDGLAAATGRPGGADALAALAIGVTAAALLLDPARALVAVLAVAVLQGGLALQARRQIGGVTGDVLGAAQQLGEAAVLLVACASLSGGI
ncbi:adenosylcobinamide-GDP ribazoletransferase [Pelagibius sp. CAU 1746]|uniref:adenosylcobinamide-GDP ribazoletransferase n=1 Tax=Pelagibius sp. CAU 1746 TaxID=3140370 RepID=UPI00325AE775